MDGRDAFGTAQKLCAATCWHAVSGVSDHSAVAMDCCTPRLPPSKGGGALYAPVWRHLLTAAPASVSAPAGRSEAAGGGAAVLGAGAGRGSDGDCTCLSYP